MGDGLVVCFDKKLCSRLLELACSSGEARWCLEFMKKRVGFLQPNIVGSAHSSEAHGEIETKRKHVVVFGLSTCFYQKLKRNTDYSLYCLDNYGVIVSGE